MRGEMIMVKRLPRTRKRVQELLPPPPGDVPPAPPQVTGAAADALSGAAVRAVTAMEYAIECLDQLGVALGDEVLRVDERVAFGAAAVQRQHLTAIRAIARRVRESGQ